MSDSAPGHDPRPEAPDAPRPDETLDAARLAPWRELHAARSLEAFERAMLALALDPTGAGCRSAWWLVSNPDRHKLEGWKLAHAGEPESVRRAEERAFADLELALDALPEPLAAAWNVAAAGAASPATLPWFLAGSHAAALVRRGNRPFGMLVGAWSGAARGAALATVAAEAGVALLALDRTLSWQRAARRAEWLGRVASAAAHEHTLGVVMECVARAAAEGAGARGAFVWRRRDADVTLLGSHGSRTREPLARQLQPWACHVVEDARERSWSIADGGAGDATLDAEAQAQIAALVVLPVMARGRTLGALALVDPHAQHPSEPAGFDAEALAYARSVAGLAALAVERVGDGEALARVRTALDDARRGQARDERMATLGEHAARFAREARHPLASIAAFARRVYRSLPEANPDRESLEIVVREAERLERMVLEPLEAAGAGPPRLRVESLNTLVQEAVTRRGEALVRRRVRLLKRLSPEMPTLLLDPERLRRAVEGLVDHALERVAIGGRVRIETRRSGAQVVFELAHDAEGEPGDLMEQLFVPFGGAAAPVPTLGLAVAQQIVREHGGELRVRREGEWGAVITLALPIGGNDDRRHGADRRRPRVDRRAELTR